MIKVNTLIQDKTILIAGASNLTGSNILRFFLKQGATVIAPVISKQELNELKKIGASIKTGKLILELAQMPDYDQAFDIAKATAEKFGKIDIGISVFNNTACNKQLSNALISDWLTMLDEELTPFFVSARIILQSMKLNRHGLYVSICNNSFFEEEKPAAFAKITSVVKMEMSRIFAEETASLNIRYRHLWADLSVLQQPIPAGKNDFYTPYTESIGRQVMNIYLNDTEPGNVFQEVIYPLKSKKVL